MNETTVIGNACDDGKVSPNGKFYEVTIADSPPKEKEGSDKKPRYVTRFLRCSLFIEEGAQAPTIKKGQRCLVVGTEFRRDWEDKGKKGVELEVKCQVLRPMGGKLNDFVDQDGASPDGIATSPGKEAKAPTPKPKAGKPKF